jgi:hypothetical protein
MEWISVKIKKPKKHNTVLCFDGIQIYSAYYEPYLGQENYIIVGSDHSGKKHERLFLIPWLNITHWMPIPKSPKIKH